jgi:hypothetical protein
MVLLVNAGKMVLKVIGDFVVSKVSTDHRV